MELDKKKSLRLLRKIKEYRAILYKETIIRIETEEEIEKMDRKRERLEREVTNTVNRLFPSVHRAITKDVKNNQLDFYLHDVPKMLMNEKFDGILMTRKSGVQVYCLGTEDEKAHFMYFMKTANYVRLYEIKNGEVVKKIRPSRALAMYEEYEKEHLKNEAK